MRHNTKKALREYTKTRDKIEALIKQGKIDFNKPSCLYSEKEMERVRLLLEKEKKAREKYYLLLSKDLGIGIAELGGHSARAGQSRSCTCKRKGGCCR